MQSISHVAGAGLLLGLLLLAVGCGDDDDWKGIDIEPVTTAMVLEPGPYGVGTTTIRLEDTTRPTMPSNGYPGSDSRVLVTEIWYPISRDLEAPPNGLRDAPVNTEGAPYPLIVYSHGFSDMRFGGGYLTRHLASHGYVLMSPDYPLTNLNAPGGPNSFDVVNQPGDISFLIDRMLDMNSFPGDRFAGAIDAKRIGLAGLSLGGLTTFLTTYHETLRDQRVKAAAPLAGPACFLGPDFYGDRRIPLLIVHGTIDAFVAYQENALFAFGQAPPPVYLVTPYEGSHAGFTDSSTSPIFSGLPNPDLLGCGAVAGDLPHGDEPSYAESLGGAAAGIIDGDCPDPCTMSPLPPTMRPARQQELTIASVLPFFEGTLRNRAEMIRFLEETLAAENMDVTIRYEK